MNREFELNPYLKYLPNQEADGMDIDHEPFEWLVNFIMLEIIWSLDGVIDWVR